MAREFGRSLPGWVSWTRGEPLTRGGPNHFTAIRHVLAICVVFDHSFGVQGWADREPLKAATSGRLETGTLAVLLFFAMSGYLVSSSWDRCSGWRDFARRRAARIYPALIAVLIASALVLGPLASVDRAHYFRSVQTWSLFANVLPLPFTFNILPGVFVGLPGTSAVNASLWTLHYEMSCYIGLAIVGTYAVRDRLRWLTAAWIFAIVLAVVHTSQPTVIMLNGQSKDLFFSLNRDAQVFASFLTGALTYAYRDRLRRSSALAGCAIAGALSAGWLGVVPMMLLGGTYLLFFVAFLPLRLRAGGPRKIDLSYGIYLAHFPIQQCLVAFTSIRGSAMFPVSLALSAVVAAVSWFVIESRFLATTKDRATADAVPIPG